MSPQLREMEDHGSALQPLLVLRTEEDYGRGLARLEEVLSPDVPLTASSTTG